MFRSGTARATAGEVIPSVGYTLSDRLRRRALTSASIAAAAYAFEQLAIRITLAGWVTR